MLREMGLPCVSLHSLVKQVRHSTHYASVSLEGREWVTAPLSLRLSRPHQLLCVVLSISVQATLGRIKWAYWSDHTYSSHLSVSENIANCKVLPFVRLPLCSHLLHYINFVFMYPTVKPSSQSARKAHWLLFLARPS